MSVKSVFNECSNRKFHNIFCGFSVIQIWNGILLGRCEWAAKHTSNKQRSRSITGNFNSYLQIEFNRCLIRYVTFVFFLHFSGRHHINCLNTWKWVRVGCLHRKFTNCLDCEMNLILISYYHSHEIEAWARPQHSFSPSNIRPVMASSAVIQAMHCTPKIQIMKSLNTM